MPTKREWFLYALASYFLAAYLGSILISIVPYALKTVPNPMAWNSYTSAVNTTMTTNFTSTLPLVGVVLGGAIVIFAVFGGFAMTRGME